MTAAFLDPWTPKKGPAEGAPGSTSPARKKGPDAARLALAVEARTGGATLRASARAAGVGLSTLCRWQAAEPALRRLLQAARQAYRNRRRAGRRKPTVPVHPACPGCSAGVVIRSRGGVVRFWACARACGFASWRPRHPVDCPGCGAPRFWSLSRRSVGCPSCGLRVGAQGPIAC